MRQDPHLCDPCIEEDARHNGHADLLREVIDGVVSIEGRWRGRCTDQRSRLA
jgi:hypothetical protein